MGERNKILMKFGYRLQKLKEFASCSAFHSNVFKQMADLRCTVARFANSYLTKEGTRGRNRHTLSKNNTGILSSSPRAFLENRAALGK